MTVLVTGASGFIGRRIVARLVAAGEAVRAAVRRPVPDLTEMAETVMVGQHGPETRWGEALAGVDLVIHAAGHVHRPEEPAEIAAERHDTVNRRATAALAEAAAEAGVRRMVFVSTVKVLGEGTRGEPFTDESPADPRDAYARSKHEGEEALFAVAARGGLEAVALRPPLVYGPGVRANFLALLKLCAGPWPLPLGRLANRRSLVFVDNLADAIVAAARSPRSAGGRFLVSDGGAVSTTALVSAIRRAMGRPARLVPAPAPLLRLAGRIAGRPAAVERLIGDAEVDDTRFRRLLGWTPPVAFDEAVAKTVEWYLGDRGRNEE